MVGKPGRKMNQRRAFFLVLLLACTAAGCGGSSYSGPPPLLLVTNTKDLGPIPTNPDILGRDGAYSALFQGASVWLYGDTFITKADAQNRTLLSNSWSFTTDLNAQADSPDFRSAWTPRARRP